MITPILKSQFQKMPWKNGKSSTSQIAIAPVGASITKNDFEIRLSSAPVEQSGDFSLYPGMSRLLTTVKGPGFELKGDVYEKFEVAAFSGDESVHCKLLKGPILDFGVIYDPKKVSLKYRMLNLKTSFGFSLEPEASYYFSVLDGSLKFKESILTDMETLVYEAESFCKLEVPKAAIVFYLEVKTI